MVGALRGLFCSASFVQSRFSLSPFKGCGFLINILHSKLLFFLNNPSYTHSICTLALKTVVILAFILSLFPINLFMCMCVLGESQLMCSEDHIRCQGSNSDKQTFYSVTVFSSSLKKVIAVMYSNRY